LDTLGFQFRGPESAYQVWEREVEAISIKFHQLLTTQNVLDNTATPAATTKPMSAFLANRKERYISRTGMISAGKANKARAAEPSLWSLIGWDRDDTSSTPVVQKPTLVQAGTQDTKQDDCWETEARASFLYYARPETISRQFKPPVDPEVAKQEKQALQRRFSLVAAEAATKAAKGDQDNKGGATKSGETKTSSSSSSSNKSKKATQLGQGGKKTKPRKRRKKKRAPQGKGPKAKFFAYGMNNTKGPINLLQTHNVLPDDPREIYPNALHAAVRHPNPAKAAMAIKKAEFLKNHQNSVSEAAEELLAALAKDARQAESTLVQKKQQSAKEIARKKQGDEPVEVLPPARRNQISNPISDPSLTMWDLLAWPGSTTIDQKVAAHDSTVTSAEAAAIAAIPVVKETTKRARRKKNDIRPTKPASVLYVERNNKSSPSGRRRITASSGLRKVTIEEIKAFEKFEPQDIEMVDPKAFANLSPAWTRNIPTAGKCNPPHTSIPL
jgi:hypothetical protein